MKYDHVLIDTSNFYMRAYAVNQDLTAELEDGTKIITGGIYTALRMANSVESKFLKEDGKMYFLFDNCYSGDNRRRLIDPDYKANRTKKDDSFYRSIDILHMLLLNYKDNWCCVQREGFEADDLVDPLVKTFPADEEVLLVSNDMDWFRSITYYCHVAKYEMKDYTIYRPVDFMEKYGFPASAENVIMYKTFRGDGSDNIPPGVPGMREKDLIRIINDYSNLSDFISKLASNMYLTSGCKEKILANQSRLRLNEKLVDFQKMSENEILESVVPSRFNAKILKSIYRSLNFQIAKIDPRVAKFFDKEETPSSPNSFFKFDKANRI